MKQCRQGALLGSLRRSPRGCLADQRSTEGRGSLLTNIQTKMVQLRDSSGLQGLMMVGGGVIPKGTNGYHYIPLDWSHKKPASHRAIGWADSWPRVLEMFVKDRFESGKEPFYLVGKWPWSGTFHFLIVFFSCQKMFYLDIYILLLLLSIYLSVCLSIYLSIYSNLF